MNQTSGEKKKKATKTKPSPSKSTKKTTKTTKTTSSKPRSKKGGNFLGSVGDLVAPTGWGSFTTAAGLLALGGLDSTYRRSSKKEKTGEVKKMKGGDGCMPIPSDSIVQTLIGKEWTSPRNNKIKSGMTGLSNWVEPAYPTIPINSKNKNNYENMKKTYNKWKNESTQSIITIKCFNQQYYYFEVTITCGDDTIIYEHKPKPGNYNKNSNQYKAYLFDTFEEAKKMSKSKDTQFALVHSALLAHHEKCKKNSNNSH